MEGTHIDRIAPEALQKFNDQIKKIKEEVHKVIVGQDQIIELFIVSLLLEGHILFEGVPGIAKTLSAKLLAKTIDAEYSRIQFTPDLMPSDITGTSVFNFKSSEFVFNRGPVFSNIILIDEINRAPAKTQAALFEVMEERQITIEGNTYKLEPPFLVIATQNPIEQEGTYRLPEAQLDRFLFRVKIDYPNLEEEVKILDRFKGELSLTQKAVANEIRAVINNKDIIESRKLIGKVHIKDALIRYITEIMQNSRNNGDLLLGASPRASIAVMKGSKVVAAMNGRDYVIPEDIKQMINPVLNHRIILNSEKEIEGYNPEDIIKEIVEAVEVPR